MDTCWSIEEQTVIELNLGLSLGGRFGVDKSLSRASSIAGTVPTLREMPEIVAALARTSSLPAETEEELRRRKEMQSLRRMEARRRRSEKQRNTKGNPGGGGSGSDINRKRQHSGSAFGSLQEAVPRKEEALNWSPPQTNTLKPPQIIRRRKTSSDHKKKKNKDGVEDMPCVFTIGDGPNGRKVQGILYKYTKGEEVRIMCVCHGTFFSPAEFVNHAEGRHVDHPLKHIVIDPSPSTF